MCSVIYILGKTSCAARLVINNKDNDFSQSDVILIGPSSPVDSSAINPVLYFLIIALAAAIVISVVTSPPPSQTLLM